MRSRAIDLPADLVDIAESVGREEGRTASGQIEYWARIGADAERRALELPRGGSELVDATSERAAVNASVDAAISAVANATSFADRLLARGVPVVVLDAGGRMVRLEPNGAATVL